MSYLTEKANYIRGLADGLDYDKDSKEGKIIGLLIELVNDLAEEVSINQDEIEEINEFNQELLDYFEDFNDFLENVLDEPIDEFPFEVEMSAGDIEDTTDAEDLYVIECSDCGTSYYASFEDFDNDRVDCPICGKHYKLSSDLLDELVENPVEGEDK